MEFYKKNYYASHLLKMLNKKYEIDSASIVEATERTKFGPRTADGPADGRTSGWTGKVKSVYPHFSFVEAGDKRSLYHHQNISGKRYQSKTRHIHSYTYRAKHTFDKFICKLVTTSTVKQEIRMIS